MILSQRQEAIRHGQAHLLELNTRVNYPARYRGRCFVPIAELPAKPPLPCCCEPINTFNRLTRSRFNQSVKLKTESNLVSINKQLSRYVDNRSAQQNEKLKGIAS